ncbi:signal peptidase II [Sphaerothrix gracilis]|uniref:signal peptidase II n=1 Tax=Sphaerothrix gracilis TaxID=3151835 RepID=UPI0031FBF0A0
MQIKNRLFWIAAIVGLILDQVSKLWVVQNFELTIPPQTVPLWQGVFHLTYVTNKGAAFSLFSENGDWLRWLSLAVSLGLIALGLGVSLANRWEEAGYGFILSGALGNGIDRLLAGEVVDFLDFRLIQFPIFNLADVFINVGIACLLLAAFRPGHSQPSSEAPSEHTRR